MSQHSARGKGWEALRLRVLARDNYECHYCHGEATQVDHVIAKANGGEDVEDNLVAACQPCNNRKGAKVLVRQAWFNPYYFNK